MRGMPARSRALVLAAVLAAASGCGRSEPGPTAPAGARSVILISIDSLRADHCTPYGRVPDFAPDEETTPFMARMAEEGVLFENAEATSPWTLPSHASLLSGMHAREHGVRQRAMALSDELELVSGRFRAAGWHTAGFFSGPFLHPVWGFGRGFEVYRPGPDYLKSDETVAAVTDLRSNQGIQRVHDASHRQAECAEPVMREAMAWLEEDDRYEEPFFLFLHLWDPHYDYYPPTEYRTRFLPDDDGSVRGDELMDMEVELTPELLRTLQALYDAEIRYTDDWIARLYARLEEWGVADDVVVVITADHGDEFLEHGKRGHRKNLYEETMRVPLVIRAPGLAPAGVRVEGSVSIADIAPTLLDLCGLEPWPERSGRSLRGIWEGRVENHSPRLDLVLARKQLLGWREGKDKLIFDEAKLSAEIYDLEADPGERNPLRLPLNADHPVARRALAALQAEPQEPPYPPIPVNEPEHLTEALSAAGYVDGD